MQYYERLSKSKYKLMYYNVYEDLNNIFVIDDKKLC